MTAPPPPGGVQQTEVSLAPAELGRVTFVIRNEEGTLTMQILAERPETLELVRRHADLLERAAADGPVRLRLEQEGAGTHRGAGHGPGADHAGGQTGDGRRGARAGGAGAAPDDAPAIPVVSGAPLPRASESRALDLRL
ncbi:flagellar hook-length control protein FliK [Jannaschia sp. W003]|uniref:flagellar hook-length control protein FliK n=1 Tax=Jannaschia sp. W003 TaxID=2867012 RepID=UPI0021A2DC85|nr:flagellar hook-length control protein FliK [Jannaschia sp. W003]UWQ21457.1 flagellar hook-length control protein FliK [Jannaschia sp. W003]